MGELVVVGFVSADTRRSPRLNRGDPFQRPGFSPSGFPHQSSRSSAIVHQTLLPPFTVPLPSFSSPLSFGDREKCSPPPSLPSQEQILRLHQFVSSLPPSQCRGQQRVEQGGVGMERKNFRFYQLVHGMQV
ncbi:hypothetical protein CEXT_476741 [Caerostris extrusa]|uniref:Uncharacterized protein n=1 Tax=Caerostris extrusa TaxID=172846 RepID=A0AAV4VKR2_CAEEX|nr:hypothetical protein CEXT_476741 [Caerostris extrusa]